MKTLTFIKAIKEMRKGKFIRKKNFIKGLYFFTENKKLIGNNPNERIYIINIGESKTIDLNFINLKPVDSGFYFLSDFDKGWLSYDLKIIDKQTI